LLKFNEKNIYIWVLISNVMKKISLLIVLFISLSASSNEVHSPFWYSISEKILAGTQQLIGSDDTPSKPAPKSKIIKKIKPVRLPLRCEQKKDTISLTPFFTLKSNGTWTEAE
jgi:hypothetical protein